MNFATRSFEIELSPIFNYLYYLKATIFIKDLCSLIPMDFFNLVITKDDWNPATEYVDIIILISFRLSCDEKSR